eukprot:455071_1
MEWFTSFECACIKCGRRVQFKLLAMQYFQAHWARTMPDLSKEGDGAHWHMYSINRSNQVKHPNKHQMHSKPNHMTLQHSKGTHDAEGHVNKTARRVHVWRMS